MILTSRKSYLVVFVSLVYLAIPGLTTSCLAAEIKILCTAALLNRQYEERKQEYIAGLKRLILFGYKPLVVESCAQGPTFLDKYAKSVFYSKTNNPGLKNKGVNEAKSMIAALEYFGFEDEDIIIKFTGRYLMTSNRFIKYVENNPKFDIFVAAVLKNGNTYTACFAMRCRCLKEMLQNINFERMETDMVCFETLLADYAKKLAQQEGRVFFIEEPFDVVCRVGLTTSIMKI